MPDFFSKLRQPRVKLYFSTPNRSHVGLTWNNVTSKELVKQPSLKRTNTRERTHQRDVK